MAACVGHRVVGPAHHLTSFEAVEVAMGAPVSALVAYFDTCRRKRNQVDYDRINAATETETEDLIEKAEELRDLVEKWIREHHSRYGI
ncbi:MAG TPA: hypothetical protein VIY49_37935 [Bryobacteraceae bacterium]